MRKRVRFLALTVALTVATALCTSPVVVCASEPDLFLLEEPALLTQDAEPANPEEPESEEPENEKAESEEAEEDAGSEEAASEAETPTAPESGSMADAGSDPDADESTKETTSAEPETPAPAPQPSTEESSGDSTDEEGGESQTPAVTYSVEVTWGTSTLTYTAGKWDTNALCYGSGTWSGNASVTVQNNSTAAVDVSCAFTSSLSGVTGSFGTGIGQLASNNSGTATLTLTGDPTSGWPANNIVGTASVSIAAVSSGEENSQ